MRRTSLALVGVLVGLLLAAPVSAQERDPFEPQPGSGQDGSGGNGSSGGNRDPFDPIGGGNNQQPDAEEPSTEDPTNPVAEPTSRPAPDDEDDDVGGTLARTGFDITTWGGIAYLLIALGAAALAFGKLMIPATVRRRRNR